MTDPEHITENPPTNSNNLKMNKNKSMEEPTGQYPRYINIEVQQDVKRKINPYKLKNYLREVTGSTLKITTNNRKTFTVEAKNKSQSRLVLNLTEIDGHNCTVQPHPFFNFARGIIYIQEYDVDEIESFKEELCKNTNIRSLISAPFIKTRNPDTIALIATFDQDYLPQSIYIPGERQDTPVYKMHNRPLMC